MMSPAPSRTCAMWLMLDSWTSAAYAKSSETRLRIRSWLLFQCGKTRGVVGLRHRMWQDFDRRFNCYESREYVTAQEFRDLESRVAALEEMLKKQELIEMTESGEKRPVANLSLLRWNQGCWSVPEPTYG